MDGEVLISVDPHKASRTLAVFDPVTRTAIDGARFVNTKDGYRELVCFAGRWHQRRWAIEGCHGAGRLLAQRLVADGERVVDVPAKLAARVRVFSKGHGRKTDRDDSVSIGLAALDADGLADVTYRQIGRDSVTQRDARACRMGKQTAAIAPGTSRQPWAIAVDCPDGASAVTPGFETQYLRHGRSRPHRRR